LVIDASLSMNRPLSSSDRQRRIDAAKEWAPLGLPYLDFRDDIGVWTFATGRYPFQQQLTPLQPATDLHKVEVKASLRSLEASRTGGTPLYATIAKAIEAVQVGWRKDARNVVIVLTDGREHTSDLPEMRQRALRDLGTRLAAADRKKSVQVFITTVPPDARCTDLPERFRADCSMAASSEQLRSTFAMTLQRLGINVR
jgi:hypothetical protein